MPNFFAACPHLIFRAAAVLALAGCAAFSGVAPTNLGGVAVGVGRAEVEAALGEPVNEQPLACGTVAVYAFDRGRRPYQSNVDIAGISPVAPILAGLISHPFLVAGQKGELDVVYGPDGRVISYFPGREADWSRAAAENGLFDERPTLAIQAQRYFAAGMAAVPAAAGWGCLCHAAHLGNAAAQLAMARSYRDGPAPVRADAVTALTWSLLAERSGAADAATESRALATAMTAGRIDAARAAAAAWRADTAACRQMLEEAGALPPSPPAS